MWAAEKYNKISVLTVLCDEFSSLPSPQDSDPPDRVSQTFNAEAALGFCTVTDCMQRSGEPAQRPARRYANSEGDGVNCIISSPLLEGSLCRSRTKVPSSILVE